MGNIKLFTIGGGGPLQPQRGPDGDFDLSAELEALKNELDAIESKYATKVSLFNYDTGNYAFNHLKTTEVDINDEPLGEYEEDFKPVILNEAVASSFNGPTNLDSDILQPGSGPTSIDTNLSQPEVGPFNFNYINVLYGPFEGPLDDTLILYHLSPNTGPISLALDSTLLPSQGPVEMDSRLIQPEDGPESISIIDLPQEGPSAFDIDVEPPSSTGTTNLSYILLPSLSPQPLTVTVQKPQQGTSNLSNGGLLPLQGPQSLDWFVNIPTSGPTNLSEAEPPPVTGPDNIATGVVAPSVGPDNIHFGHNDPLTDGPTNLASDLLIPPLEGPTFFEFKSTLFLWQGPEVYTASVGVDVAYNIVDNTITSAGYNRGALLIQPRIGHGRFTPYLNGNEHARTYENAWWFTIPDDYYWRELGNGTYYHDPQYLSFAFRYYSNRVRWLQEGKLPQAYPFQWEANELNDPVEGNPYKWDTNVGLMYLPIKTWQEGIDDPRSWMYPCDNAYLGSVSSSDEGDIQNWFFNPSTIPLWNPGTVLYPAEDVVENVCDTLHYIDPSLFANDLTKISYQYPIKYNYGEKGFGDPTYGYVVLEKGYQLFGYWGGGHVHYDYAESAFKFAPCKHLQSGTNVTAKAVFTDKWGFCGMSRQYIETDKITPIYENVYGPVYKGGRQKHLTSRLGTDNPPGSKITYFIGEDNTVYAVGDNSWGGFANGGWAEARYPEGYNFYKHDASWSVEERAGNALSKNDFPHNRRPVPEALAGSQYLNIEEIAIGEHHAIFRTAGGETYGLGRNVFGQQSTNHDLNQHVDNKDLEVNSILTKTTETNVAQVSCGPHHSVFTKNDGTVTIAGLTGYPVHPLINFDYLSDDYDAGLLTAYSVWDSQYLKYYQSLGSDYYGFNFRLRQGKYDLQTSDLNLSTRTFGGVKYPNWVTALAGTGEQTYQEWGVSFGTENHLQTQIPFADLEPDNDPDNDTNTTSIATTTEPDVTSYAPVYAYFREFLIGGSASYWLINIFTTSTSGAMRTEEPGQWASSGTGASGFPIKSYDNGVFEEHEGSFNYPNDKDFPIYIYYYKENVTVNGRAKTRHWTFAVGKDDRYEWDQWTRFGQSTTGQRPNSGVFQQAWETEGHNTKTGLSIDGRKLKCGKLWAVSTITETEYEEREIVPTDLDEISPKSWSLVPNTYLSRARTVLASDGSPFGGVHKSVGGMSCFYSNIGWRRADTKGPHHLEADWEEYLLNPDTRHDWEYYGTTQHRWANRHFATTDINFFYGPTTLFLKRDGTVWGVGCNGGGVLNVNQESDFYKTPTQLVWPSGDPIENIIDVDMTSNEACLVDSAGRLFVIANYEIYQPVDSNGKYIQPGWARVKMGGGVKAPDSTITSSNNRKSTNYKFQSSVMVRDKNGVWATFGVNNRGNLGLEIEDGSRMTLEPSPVYINLARPTSGPSSLGFPKNDAIQVHTVGYYWPAEECSPTTPEAGCARPQLAPSSYKWNTPDEGHRFDSQAGSSKYYLDFLFTDSEGKLIDPSEFNFIKMKGPDYWSNLVPDGNSGYYGAVLNSPTVRDHLGNEINPADKFPEYADNPKIFRAYFQWKIGSFRLGDGVGYSQRWILKPTMNMNNQIEVHSNHPTLGFDTTIKHRQLLNPHDYYYDHADTIIKEFRYTSGEVHKTITTQDQLDADYDNFIPSRHNKANIIISGEPGETVTFDVVLLTTGPLDVNIGRLFDSYYTQRAWATPVSYTKVDNHTAILRLRTTLPSTAGTYYCNRVPAGISFQDIDPSKVPNGYPLRSNIPNSHWSNNGFANLLRLKCVYLKENYLNFTKDTYFGCTMYVGQKPATSPSNFQVEEIGYPPESKEVTSISAGSDFCSILTKTNDLWCSGKGDLGQNGAGLENRSLWLKVLSNVSSHASGAHHQLAIVNGSLYATGKNSFAQLGNKGRDNLSTFTHISDLDGPSPITQVACGENHSAFLRSNGTVWVMGSGEMGQYGDGNLSQNDRAPRQVAQDAVFVACGPNTTYYIDVDGNLYGTGDNTAYQLRNQSSIETFEKYFKFLDGGVESVKGGKTCTIFKKSDRVLYALGTNVNQMFGYTRGFVLIEPETINFDVDEYSVSDSCLAYVARNNLYFSGWFRLDGRDRNFKDRDSYVIRQKHDFTGSGEQYYLPHDESEHLHILNVLAADVDIVELAEGAIFYKDLNKYLYAHSGDYQGYNWLGFTDPGIYKGSQYTRTSNPKTGTNGKSKVIFG